jgi:ABC-type branched-subunit amino acid transport system substrate-binding protein
MMAVAVAGLVVSAATACGARWSDDQRAAVLARERGRSVPAAGSEGAPGEAAGDLSGSEAGGSSLSAQGSGTSGPAGGSGAGAAGSASRAAAGPGGPRPCAAPSNENGVSPTTITVGAISSESGPVPGLGSSAAAAVRALVAQRNATGGVCARKIVLKEADDGTDNARYRSTLRNLNPQVLGISGGFALGDIGSEDLINELQIPIVNGPGADTWRVRWVVDINPDLPKPDMVLGKYKYLYDQGARKVSMTYLAVDQSRREANIQRKLMEAAGLQIVHVNELPLSTLSYDSAARAAANSGANYLWFIADTNGAANMAKSVHDTGHKWLFKEFSYTTYGTKFIELAGAEAAEGATSWIRSLPTEEASSNKAMGAYVEWMDRVAPGLPQDLFSIDSYVSAKVFFEALEALPGPISRDALVKQLESIESYDAAGMFGPIALGKEQSRGCTVGMIVQGGKWRRMAPASGFLC